MPDESYGQSAETDCPFFVPFPGISALRRTKKKTPEHYLLDGVFEKSLAAAYFPT